MEAFHTLQEYIVFTKGWEYVLAIAFILAFIGYWWLVNGGRRVEEQKGIAAQAPALLIADGDPEGATGGAPEVAGEEEPPLLERELGG